MPLFKKEDAAIITTYIPQAFTDERSVVKNAEFSKFVEESKGDSFEIDNKISEQIGLSAAKEKEQQRRFDIEVMKYVQKIKDAAFQEAYDQGYQEGLKNAHKEAFDKVKEQFMEALSAVHNIVQELENTKSLSYKDNEKEIIGFCYLVAEKIIQREIQNDPHFVLPLVKKIIDSDTSHSEVTVFCSKKDHERLMSLLNHAEFTEYKNLKIESREDLNLGDIVVETSQGSIDGSLDGRLQKLKNILSDNSSYEN